MHWATGVRFSQISRDRLREVFLAYEKFHLEQWDVFGPDPLNDMIAEEAGRHMGAQIRSLRMNRNNFITILDEGFRQARAWVGALLRLRRAELDQQIRAGPPPATFWHWFTEVPSTDSAHHPYAAPAVRQMFASGVSMPEVLSSLLVGRYTEVYTLPLESEVWERAHGRVPVSPLQLQMATSALDEVFRRLAAQEQGVPLPPSREAEGEDTCIQGQKLCHQNIVPDDGRRRYLWLDNWICYC
jgi:hypothetical protein